MDHNQFRKGSKSSYRNCVKVLSPQLIKNILFLDINKKIIHQIQSTWNLVDAHSITARACTTLISHNNLFFHNFMSKSSSFVQSLQLQTLITLSHSDARCVQGTLHTSR